MKQFNYSCTVYFKKNAGEEQAPYIVIDKSKT